MNFNSLLSIILSLSNGNTSKAFSEFLSVLTSGLVAATSELEKYNSALSKVAGTSSFTSKELNEISVASANAAARYGKHASDYVAAAGAIYDSGAANAAQLTDLCAALQNSAGMSSEMSSGYILAANSAYTLHDGVDSLIDILDGQNSIINSTSAGLKDMAEATILAAASAAQCGISADEFSALAATALDGTAMSGKAAGSMLNSIFNTLSNLSDPSIISALNSVGISITDISEGSNALRSPIQLISELADQFNTLDSSSKNSIADILGTDAAPLTAFMSNMKSYSDNLALYRASAVSLIDSSAATSSELNKAVNKFSAAWDATAGNLIDTDDIADAVNALTKLLSVVESVTDVIGGKGAIALSAGAAGLASFIKNFD